MGTKEIKKTDNNSPPKQGRCYVCNKTSHWARDCRSKKKSGKYRSLNETEGDALMIEMLTSVTEHNIDTNAWYLDSGASDHMCNHREWFVNFSKFERHLPVRMGNGEYIFAHGKGDINILAFDGCKWIKRHLSKVLYIPGIKYNLFSVGAALDKGLQLIKSKFIKVEIE